MTSAQWGTGQVAKDFKKKNACALSGEGGWAGSDVLSSEIRSYLKTQRIGWESNCPHQTKAAPWLLCPVWSFAVSKKSFPSMDQITPYQSIKEEAVRRKFARFKQVDRARAEEGLEKELGEVGHWLRNGEGKEEDQRCERHRVSRWQPRVKTEFRVRKRERAKQRLTDRENVGEGETKNEPTKAFNTFSWVLQARRWGLRKRH